MPGQKQKYLDKNRNAWTKAEILGKNRNAWTKNGNTCTEIEIFEQKRRYLDKGRSISIKGKYTDRKENNWTKTNILEKKNPIPLPRGLA